MRIRTGYSFRTAVGHVDEVISRLKEIGWKDAPICDHVSTFGFNVFTKAAKKAGLRPIYGVELPVVTAEGDKKPVADYWSFFAKDALRPLHDLVALATAAPGHEPALTYKQALDAPGLIKFSGERVQLSLLPKKQPQDFFIGLSPSTPKILVSEAMKHGYKFIATSDNNFPREADREFYRVAMGKRSNNQTYPQHILSDKEWREATSWFASKKNQDEALRNRDAAMKRCKVEMKYGKLLTPDKPKSLRQLCIEGAKRTGTNLNNPVYKERLERELKLIAEKKFEDYFFIIADLVNYAKGIMIVGPARGSSCGSLVCYLLNITAIDPIPYGLIFERFIDTTRKDLPDIDIDFSDERRKFVFEYAEQKFGKDRVARLGTVGLFKPRSALNQAGTTLQIPKWLIEKTLDGVIERSSGDSRAMFALEDTLSETEMGRKLLNEYPEVRIATRMEGHPNNPSQHAAGIVITDEPMAEYAAVDSRTKSAMVVKKDAEDLNLLKIDALGLAQLSIFERTLELLGEKSISGWLEKLPLDDKKAFDVLNKGHFAGIFQFTGMALQSLTRQVKIEKLDDMVSITALARPGPLATGGANAWVKRKNGKESTDTIHPLLTKLTKETYGVVIYQEQVMNIVREIGKFSWEETSAIRKAMSGRLGDEFFERYRLNFHKGAKANGIDERTAEEIWRHINTMGSWAFNKSHAVAYGVVSYWCCYLKAHHPLEFAAATLDSETDPQKQIGILRELEREGIKYIPVDVDHSTDHWGIVKKGKKRSLVGPLTAIKGIGPAAVINIMDSRRSGKPLGEALRKRLENAKTEIDTLYPLRSRVLEVVGGDLKNRNITSEPASIADVQCDPDGEYEVVVIAVPQRIAPRDENDPANVTKRLLRYEEKNGGKNPNEWDGKLRGETWALNMFVRDDTDEIFCKVDRYRFRELAQDIINRGRPGKAIYAIKGRVPRDFRMISIQSVRYLGDMELDEDVAGKENAQAN